MLKAIYIATVSSIMIATAALSADLRPVATACLSGDHLDANVRFMAALGIEDEYKKLYDAIPELSPSEAAWLKGEVDDQLAGSKEFNARAAAAINSTEYKKSAVKKTTNNIIKFADQLKTEKDPKNELRLWALMLSEMSEVSFASNAVGLVQAKVIQEQSLPLSSGTNTFEALQQMLVQCSLKYVITSIIE